MQTTLSGEYASTRTLSEPALNFPQGCSVITNWGRISVSYLLNFTSLEHAPEARQQPSPPAPHLPTAHRFDSSTASDQGIIMSSTAGNLPELSAEERAGTEPALLHVIENRKSGLSLNHIVGCPLDCAYCVRHLFGNFAMKRPHMLMSDAEAVRTLLSHPYFCPDRTPIQVFNRATDPFLPNVKPHTFRVLELLATEGIRNHVLLITRFRVTEADAKRLNEFTPLRVTLLVTYSGANDRAIEPLGSTPAIRSLMTAYRAAEQYRVILYWRPLIAGVNDSDAHIARALRLSASAHATVFTGLFYRDQIRDHFQANGVAEPYAETARRKILTQDTEDRILAAFAPTEVALFRKTSCAVAYVHKAPDYNGHYGIRTICDICPSAQLARCADAFRVPTRAAVDKLAGDVGTRTPYIIDDGAIRFDGLGEQQRYYMQHTLGFQVHDRGYPHHRGRHGRAETGWGSAGDSGIPVAIDGNDQDALGEI